MGFRLRYLQHDLELTQGQFAVGRNASCQLSLDDPLVSRRHALLLVSPDAVHIEDLQSRNGVLVNGERIQGRTPLRVGDRIVIGAQELVLLQGREPGAVTSSANVAKLTLPKITSAPPSTPSLSSVGGQPVDADPEPSMVRRLQAFQLLGGVAEKALGLGRASEAERLLASPLAEVIEAGRAGRRIPPSLVDDAARFAAKLASATGKAGWADYVVELCATQARLCPAVVIDELYVAFRKVATVDVMRLRAYLDLLRENAAAHGPAERFLVQRLEGLERLAALR